MPVAPASLAARTTSRSCSGRSEIPGRIGAIPTFAFTPASTSAVTAFSRWRGCAVEGSVRFQTSWSSVGTENVTETFVRLAASTSTSMSRTIIGPRVMIPNGFAASRNTSRHARVSLYFPSTGWYGSVAAPTVTCSCRHVGRPSSLRNTSATFVFTRIDVP